MIDEMHINVQIRNYTDCLKKSDNLLGYILAVVTTTLALVTSDFRDVSGIAAIYWQDIFLLIGGGLIVLAFLAAKARLKHKEMTPEQLIETIKAKSIQPDKTPVSIKPF